MNASEPRARRRGFFLHSADGTESDSGEHENPEGFIVRVRIRRSSSRRQFSAGGRARPEAQPEEGRPQIRSGSVTGSRQRAHLPR